LVSGREGERIPQIYKRICTHNIHILCHVHTHTHTHIHTHTHAHTHTHTHTYTRTHRQGVRHAYRVFQKQVACFKYTHAHTLGELCVHIGVCVCLAFISTMSHGPRVSLYRPAVVCACVFLLVCHVSYLCVLSLISTCAMTLPYVCHDTFLCVP